MTRQVRIRKLDEASRMLREMSPVVGEALDNIREELDAIGFPSNGGGAGKVSGGSSSDPAGGDATRAYELTGSRDDLRDAIADILNRAAVLYRIARRWAPQDRPAMSMGRCSDAWHGREGSGVWAVDDQCDALPDVRGLCSLHYHRERRWRIAEGLPTREEPAA